MPWIIGISIVVGVIIWMAGKSPQLEVNAKKVYQDGPQALKQDPNNPDLNP